MQTWELNNCFKGDRGPSKVHLQGVSWAVSFIRVSATLRDLVTVNQEAWNSPLQVLGCCKSAPALLPGSEKEDRIPHLLQKR